MHAGQATHFEHQAVLTVIPQPGLAEEHVQQACAFISNLNPVQVPPVTRQGGPEPYGQLSERPQVAGRVHRKPLSLHVIMITITVIICNHDYT